VDFNILNDAMNHWLSNISGVWLDPSKLQVRKFDMGMTCCIFILPLDLHSAVSFHMSMFGKHCGFDTLPIVKGISTSNDIKSQRKQQFFFFSFLPEHFSPFRHCIVFGSAWKDSPVSSPFAVFSDSYTTFMVGHLATHSSMVSLVTSFDSSQS
jgi:hypothetical protein